MAHKKQGGKLKQQKRPQPKFLGVKVNHGEKVESGSILVRQRGTKFSAGRGVRVARDHSLYAAKPGLVKFSEKFNKKVVSIES